jgi:drug/metabolite transporter (DMT)-like permease
LEAPGVPQPRADADAGAPDRPALAAVLQLLSTAFMVAVATLVKLAGAEATPMQAVLFRSLFSIPPLGLAMVRQRAHPWSRRWRLLTVRGVVGFLALGCYFMAIARTELANVLVLQQLAPMFVAFLAVALLRERPRRIHYLLAAVCLAGALLVIQPDRGVASLGALYALGAAVCSSLAYVSVRALTRTEPTARIVLWFSAVATLLSLPLALPGWRWPSLRASLLLAGAGLLAAPMQSCMTAAYRRAPAHVVAAFSYSSVPLAYLSGVALWGEQPSLTAHAGIALIVIGGVWLVVSLRAQA